MTSQIHLRSILIFKGYCWCFFICIVNEHYNQKWAAEKQKRSYIGYCIKTCGGFKNAFSNSSQNQRILVLNKLHLQNTVSIQWYIISSINRKMLLLCHRLYQTLYKSDCIANKQNAFELALWIKTLLGWCMLAIGLKIEGRDL